MFGRNEETRKINLPDGPSKPDVERPGLPPGIAQPSVSSEPVKPVDEILSQLSQGYRHKARADNTRRAYENDFRRFREWCEDGGYECLPASEETVAFYLADHAEEYAVASLRRWLVGIALVHKEAGLVSPTNSLNVRDTMKGIRREAVEEGREPRRAYPLVLAGLRRLVEPINTGADATLLELRDRAMFNVAWTCAMRASEVGTIRVGDLTETPRGYVVSLRKSKTNQEGKPHRKAMPNAKEGNEIVCPNLALKAWLNAMPPVEKGENKNRPVFCYVDRHGRLGKNGITPRSVNRIIQARARVAGFPDDVIELLTCHSLRRGFATAAAQGKAIESKALEHIGWKDGRMYRHYVEHAELFDDHAATAAGL